MDSVYKLLDKLKTHIRSGDFTKKVTEGDLSSVDLDKHNIYPLAHIKIDAARIEQSTITFTVKILAADIVDWSQDNTGDDVFYGNDNLQDVLNTQLQVINRIFMFLRKGDLRDEGYETDEFVRAIPFRERFEMSLAGWRADFTIRILNDFAIC